MTGMQPPDFLYWYRARVVSVYDADTVYLDLDLGTGVHNLGHDGRGLPVRLYGINAPELRGEEKEAGYAARDALISLLAPGAEISGLESDWRRAVLPDDAGYVTVNTIRDEGGKYGRLLAQVYVQAPDGRWTHVNKRLVDLGHARDREY